MEASISPLDLARQLEIVVDSLSPDGGSKAFSLKAEEKTSLLLAASKLIDVLEPPDSRMLSVALAVSCDPLSPELRLPLPFLSTHRENPCWIIRFKFQTFYLEISIENEISLREDDSLVVMQPSVQLAK